MNVTTSTVPQRLFILGGTGFVGHQLAARLTRAGHSLTLLTRHRERHRDLLVLPRLRVVEADVHDEAALERHLEGHDAAINLVGILNERGHDGRGFYRAHVDLPRKLVQACRRRNVTRLLHMSALGADAAYGTSHYQRSKGEGENLVHATVGLQVTSFRPSVIFGPGDAFFNRFADLLRLTPVFPLACPDARFAPIFVGDVAEAFARALDNPATIGRRYDLCGPREYRFRDLIDYTARLIGRRPLVVGLPDSLSRLQANLFEYLPGKPFSRDNYLSLQRDNVCSGPIAPELAIVPTPLEAVVPGYLK
jgi:NADH dehydrogenase